MARLLAIRAYGGGALRAELRSPVWRAHWLITAIATALAWLAPVPFWTTGEVLGGALVGIQISMTALTLAIRSGRAIRAPVLSTADAGWPATATVGAATLLSVGTGLALAAAQYIVFRNQLSDIEFGSFLATTMAHVGWLSLILASWGTLWQSLLGGRWAPWAVGSWMVLAAWFSISEHTRAATWLMIPNLGPLLSTPTFRGDAAIWAAAPQLAVNAGLALALAVVLIRTRLQQNGPRWFDPAEVAS